MIKSRLNMGVVIFFAMRLITFSGPPSSGKTSVILRLIDNLACVKDHIGVVKFDCLNSFDHERYNEAGLKNVTGLSGRFCPDHFYVSNIEGAIDWGRKKNLELLVTESAGLCNRCSPHVTGVLSVCVIDNLSGSNTPKKIGPMLKLADVVVITKGDIVSQAEREVFAFNVKQVNTSAKIIFVNGITGQGVGILAKQVAAYPHSPELKNLKLRFTTPAAVCSYCTGEMRIGEEFRMGTMKIMEFDDK